MMKVLHISTAKSWRGGERQVKFLIDGQRGAGDEVYLMSPENSELSIRCRSKLAEHINYSNGVIYTLANLRKLVNTCLKHKVDLVHAHDSHAHTLLWLALKYMNLPTTSILTRRLAIPIRPSSRKKYNFAKINKIVCVSNAVKEAMINDISDPTRLSVIHSGVDLSDVPLVQKTSNQLTIGYVGAFTREKDHATFVEVARKISQEHAHVNFLLVGDGLLLSEVQESCADFKDKVVFTGFVSDVDSEYSKMDVILHTSNAEALGTSLIDGMKFGIPIVANDVGGISELIDHGQNGFLCNENTISEKVKFISRLINNAELRSEFGESSKKKVTSFDKEEMVLSYRRLYSQILEM